MRFHLANDSPVSNQACVIEPGHDAWVVGDEVYVGLDFSEQLAEYAKPKE
jgi:hypothetical protein